MVDPDPTKPHDAPKAKSPARSVVAHVGKPRTRRLDIDEVDLSVVLVDVDHHDQGAHLRLDFDVVLQPVRFKMRDGFYSFAASGANVTLRLRSGAILRGTESSYVAVKHVKKTTERKSGSVAFEPTFKIDTGESEAEASIGKIGSKVEDEESRTATFETAEAQLEAIPASPQKLTWEIRRPDTTPVMAEYIAGRRKFFAEVQWDRDEVAGSVEVQPDSIQVYNPSRKHSGRIKSAIARFLLWRDGIALLHCSGVDLPFLYDVQTS